MLSILRHSLRRICPPTSSHLPSSSSLAAFSSCHISNHPPSQAAVECQREAERLRYHRRKQEDPEGYQNFLAKRREYYTLWRARKIQEDPEYLTRQNKYTRAWRAKKFQEDPEYKLRLDEAIRAWGKQNAEVLKQQRQAFRDKQSVEWRRNHLQVARHKYDRNLDPLKRAERQKSKKESYRMRRSTNPHFKFYTSLYMWFHTNKDRLHLCAWRQWEPQFYAERVERPCATCGKTRLDGLKLWFKRIEDPAIGQYDCFQCYASWDWSEITPIEIRDPKLRFYKPKDPMILAMLESRAQDPQTKRRSQ